MNDFKKLPLIMRSRYLSYILFVYISLFLQSPAAATEQYYLLFRSGELFEKASLCEEYIKSNSTSFANQINDITFQYKAKSFAKANNLIQRPEFIRYKNYLWDCSLYITYTGDINYFQEAYTYLFKLIINVEQAHETGIYDLKEMDNVEISIIDNLDKILFSQKITR